MCPWLVRPGEKATSVHQKPCGADSPDFYSSIRKHSKFLPTYPNSHCTKPNADPAHPFRQIHGSPPRPGTSTDRCGPSEPTRTCESHPRVSTRIRSYPPSRWKLTSPRRPGTTPPACAPSKPRRARNSCRSPNSSLTRPRRRSTPLTPPRPPPAPSPRTPASAESSRPRASGLYLASPAATPWRCHPPSRKTSRPRPRTRRSSPRRRARGWTPSTWSPKSSTPWLSCPTTRSINRFCLLKGSNTKRHRSVWSITLFCVVEPESTTTILLSLVILNSNMIIITLIWINCWYF